MVDAVEAIYAEVPPIKCQGLCVKCCCPVGDLMTEFERDRITKATGKKPNTHKDGRKVCNFLVDGKCSIYAIRPAICRIYGIDRSLPCIFGCEGANTRPERWGSQLINRVSEAVEAYGAHRGEIPQALEGLKRRTS